MKSLNGFLRLFYSLVQHHPQKLELPALGSQPDLATPLHFNKLRIVLVIVFLAATLVRALAESHDMEAAAALPGLEERERLEMKRLKLSVLLCLSAAVLIIVRRPQRNHPSETLSTEEDCSWLNHGGFPTKGFDGH